MFPHPHSPHHNRLKINTQGLVFICFHCLSPKGDSRHSFHYFPRLTWRTDHFKAIGNQISKVEQSHSTRHSPVEHGSIFSHINFRGSAHSNPPPKQR
ncbi:hypothetical protein EUGRSUZ_A00741 [Eucalyptus grandis]|uniref:Uncharacterized protein n=2 Tax=Eucalyptus grandis TaxID=71139 RepID=A0ACC3M0U6_EUCGR|nr:hypothetical protein EUGRSUZ_A00741 [Eucalyptus grandis]